ncbi:hypothetical protein [Saccharospirillum salsuginis]|uniref:hypothetical protein n=1 Tax=Saccharospirillum salsuginis TaxID=418750 RepID=UPI00167BE329|nr:hypothetical protein [Saccharospirillum salsuginis]
MLGISCLSVTASAETFIEAITNCRKINNTEARYQCYDRAESQVSNVKRNVAKFNYESTSDPITGQTVHNLSIRSDRGLNGRGDPIILELSCDSTKPGTYELVLRWKDFLESSNPNVTTRLGQTPSVTEEWETDRSRESSIFTDTPEGYTKQSLMETLVSEVENGNPSIVFRATPYNDDPITAVFDFTGFLDVIEPMRESCQF